MFEKRGYLLDLSRGRVPTARTFRLIVDLLARYRYNQLQLAMDESFAAADDGSGWDEPVALASAEIAKLDAYCELQGIELVPCVTLTAEHRRLRAETDDLFGGLVDSFRSRLVTVFCRPSSDEFDRGEDPAEVMKAVVALKRRGKIPLLAADFALAHPEALARPADGSAALVWGYEANHPFDEEAKALETAGVGFYVCPGSSAWHSLAGRVENMRENLEAAERAGRGFGAKGYLLADWGGEGHWQPLAASLPALAMAGNFAFSGAKSAKMDLERELNSIMDAPLGGLLLRLGTLYLRGGAVRQDRSELFDILVHDRGYSRHPGLTDAILDEIGGIAAGVRIAATRYAETNDWAKEIVYMANLVDCACHRRDESRLRALRDEHGRVWRLRSREGGRVASLMKLPRF